MDFGNPTVPCGGCCRIGRRGAVSTAPLLCIYKVLAKKAKSCRIFPVMPNTEKTTPTTQKLRGASKKAIKSTEAQEAGFAIFETGGKQYRVSVGDSIKIEKILGDHKEGDSLVFDKVLLTDNGKDVTNIGTPYVEGAKVSGTLVEIGRAAKVTVIKYKQKSRYLKKNGHRQPYFKVQINKIA